MLFNSLEFIFIFLPVSLVIYFFLNRKRLTSASRAWLVLCSLFFYSWWNVVYLQLILTSMLINYAIGSILSQKEKLSNINRRTTLIIGILFNLSLLGYFKYADFFIFTLNSLSKTNIQLLHLALPLAISFFTFQQIAYLVDSFRRETFEYDFLNYALFVTFFPQLIAGPIVHHGEMMPQFKSIRNKIFNYKNLSIGVFLFSIGLFKKIVIADTFAEFANAGFDNTDLLTFVEAWCASLSYTFQLYFDFSGYTDMAIGVGYMFNIKLPNNFNSPYKARDIQDFWRRWHITLSRFLRDYIYIPLGGNRKGSFHTYNNLFVTFLIGGLWHGAGWTFVFWGGLHGIAIVVHRLWQQIGVKMNRFLSWVLTFNFVNIAWVFFRAEDWQSAIKVLKGMLGLEGIIVSRHLLKKIPSLEEWGFSVGQPLVNMQVSEDVFKWVIAAMILIFLKNSLEIVQQFKPNRISSVYVVVLWIFVLASANKVSEFLYFNF